MAERGTFWLNLTGGEPLLRKDFREIWLFAKNKGFILSLFTNATLIDEEMAEFLSDYPPQCLEVSIYGATRETYERITGVRGSYDRFMRGIGHIRARGLPWLLKAPLIDGLVDELDAIRALAEEWDVRLMVDGAINASTGEGASGGKAPCATRLSDERLAEFEASAPGATELAGLLAEEIRALPAPAPDASEDLFTCGAGINMYYVTARGQLQMCALTGHRGESLVEGEGLAERFDAGWSRFAEVRKLKLRPDSPCVGCDLSGICKSCPGFAHLENGDEHSAVEWLCRSTHLKALKMGLPHKCDIKHFVYTPSRKP
jgi:radical SAM protein with 4Fe4S-binding SPASM domain